MRLKAYILAADPAWIEASVLSYYDMVEEIIVSYDESGLGWTGAPIAAEQCLRRLRAIDRDSKMRYCSGQFARPGHEPIENDTFQRQCALGEACKGADWVIQIDTDEVLPNPSALVEMLAIADQRQIPAVEWPMRVLFRRMSGGGFLEVCASNGSPRFEYPGPIAVRGDVEFYDARRTRGAFLRPIVPGDHVSLQIINDLVPGEVRVSLTKESDAILHNSWARTPASIRSKIASWSHNAGWRSWMFYYLRWRPAPYIWRSMRDFHPFARGLWPALRPCRCIPKGLANAG